MNHCPADKFAHCERAVPGSLRLLPDDCRLPDLEREHRDMRDVSFEEPPSLAQVSERPIQLDWTRRLAGVGLTYADGLLICPLHLGAVVAVDVDTRQLRWAFLYGDARDAQAALYADPRSRTGSSDPQSRWRSRTGRARRRRVPRAYRSREVPRSRPFATHLQAWSGYRDDERRSSGR